MPSSLTYLFPPTLKSTITPILESSTNFSIPYEVIEVPDSFNVKISRYKDNYIIYNNNVNYRADSIIINKNDLNPQGLQNGDLYKVQLRGVYESLGSTQYSEWSNVMVLKAIKDPELTLVLSDNSVSTPTFLGVCDSPDDIENKYKFSLYSIKMQGGTIVKDKLLEETEYISHLSANNTADTHRFKYQFENYNYIIKYSILTINDFFIEKEKEFTIDIPHRQTTLQNITVEADEEEGRNIITISNLSAGSNTYVISRAEEGSLNYWEDIYTTVGNGSGNISFVDYVIESGKIYKYGVQKEANNVRTERKITDPIENNYYFTYLFNNDKQLKLSLNNNISSYKKTLLSAKQDSIGSKYPIINKNGYSYYREFPISATISLHMDDNKVFFKNGADGLYYNAELVIPNRKLTENLTYRGNEHTPNLTIGTDVTNENMYAERIFREKVIDFLNKTDYFVYKSPTEGIFIITLINVSTAPKQNLSRMTCDVSATAYEVMDLTFENLKDFKII